MMPHRVKSMKNAIQLLVPPVPSDQAAMAPDESGYSLNIAGVYQDSVTKEWAMQTCRRATPRGLRFSK